MEVAKPLRTIRALKRLIRDPFFVCLPYGDKKTNDQTNETSNWLFWDICGLGWVGGLALFLIGRNQSPSLSRATRLFIFVLVEEDRRGNRCRFTCLL